MHAHACMSSPRKRSAQFRIAHHGQGKSVCEALRIVRLLPESRRQFVGRSPGKLPCLGCTTGTPAAIASSTKIPFGSAYTVGVESISMDSKNAIFSVPTIHCSVILEGQIPLFSTGAQIPLQNTRDFRAPGIRPPGVCSSAPRRERCETLRRARAILFRARCARSSRSQAVPPVLEGAASG